MRKASIYAIILISIWGDFMINKTDYPVFSHFFNEFRIMKFSLDETLNLFQEWETADFIKKLKAETLSLQQLFQNESQRDEIREYMNWMKVKHIEMIFEGILNFHTSQ